MVKKVDFGKIGGKKNKAKNQGKPRLVKSLEKIAKKKSGFRKKHHHS